MPEGFLVGYLQKPDLPRGIHSLDDLLNFICNARTMRHSRSECQERWLFHSIVQVSKFSSDGGFVAAASLPQLSSLQLQLCVILHWPFG